MIAIGIDPGVHTGLAIAVNGRLTELHETDFWGAIDKINLYPAAFIVVELPDTKHVWHGEAKSKGAIQRTGVNVGSVIREAQLLVDYLRRNKRQFFSTKPVGKANHAQFVKMTGWDGGQTNQHKRDAGLLVYGLKVR